jgi:DivIVA domain-containing protein
METNLELTSQVLRDVEFRETWKGYNQSDVDAFLDEVAAGVDALHAKIRELDERPAQTVTAPPSDDAVKRTLQLAQRAADLVVSEAKGVAARTIEEANSQAKRITSDAEHFALRHKEETETEAKRSYESHLIAADAAHGERRYQLEAERVVIEKEIQDRRAELEHLRFLASAARDNVRSLLTDQLTRIDALAHAVPEQPASVLGVSGLGANSSD